MFIVEHESWLFIQIDQVCTCVLNCFNNQEILGSNLPPVRANNNNKLIIYSRKFCNLIFKFSLTLATILISCLKLHFNQSLQNYAQITAYYAPVTAIYSKVESGFNRILVEVETFKKSIIWKIMRELSGLRFTLFIIFFHVFADIWLVRYQLLIIYLCTVHWITHA